MRLFISNFKGVFGIFGAFLAFFALYNLALFVFKPEITTYQNQWQSNLVFAQEYIYSSQTPKAVVLGSSLASRLDKDLLESVGIYNLAFGGGSVQSGLEIIRRSNKIPQILYIETNVLFERDVDSAMLGILFDPLLFRARYYLPALQEKYQPLNIFVNFIKHFGGKTKEEKRSTKRDEKIYNLSMEGFLKRYQQPLVNLQNYQNRLDLLQKQLQYFENKGVKIIFFTMPIDPLLAKQPRFIEENTLLKQSFSYPFLPMPNHSEYETSDGVHLLYESAESFSKAFVKEIQNFEQNPTESKSL